MNLLLLSGAGAALGMLEFVGETVATGGEASLGVSVTSDAYEALFISGAYKVTESGTADNASTLGLQLNSDSTSKYDNGIAFFGSTTVGNKQAQNIDDNTAIRVIQTQFDGQWGYFTAILWNVSNTSLETFAQVQALATDDATPANMNQYDNRCVWNNTEAVTQIDAVLVATDDDFDANSQIQVWGLKKS